jgi:hypothetical protein
MTSKRALPSGPLVSPKVAADLAGIDPGELDALVRTGAVRSERIKSRLFVNLDDAERLADRRRKGGMNEG